MTELDLCNECDNDILEHQTSVSRKGITYHEHCVKAWINHHYNSDDSESDSTYEPSDSESDKSDSDNYGLSSASKYCEPNGYIDSYRNTSCNTNYGDSDSDSDSSDSFNSDDDNEDRISSDKHTNDIIASMLKEFEASQI